jgi:hypothetical protein
MNDNIHIIYSGILCLFIRKICPLSWYGRRLIKNLQPLSINKKINNISGICIDHNETLSRSIKYVPTNITIANNA